jgi:hypothetical protein
VLEELEGLKSCQEAKKEKYGVSRSKEEENKVVKNVRGPHSDLIS